MTPTRRIPTVTLVVAMRNEAAYIERCLASIAAQDHPADALEVLVYDGESDDDSVALAEAFAAGRPGWAVRPNPRRIQAAAWNAGIATARGDIVGIVSGHAELAPTYVSAAVAALERTGADMVGGPVTAIGEGAGRRGGRDRDEHAVRGRRGAPPLPDRSGRGRHRLHGPVPPRDVPALPVRRDDGPQPGRRAELSAPRRRRPDRLRPGDPERRTGAARRCAGCGASTSTTDAGRCSCCAAIPSQVRPRHLAPVVLVTTLAAGVALAPVARPIRALLILELGFYAAATAVAVARYGSGKPPDGRRRRSRSSTRCSTCRTGWACSAACGSSAAAPYPARPPAGRSRPGFDDGQRAAAGGGSPNRRPSTSRRSVVAGVDRPRHPPVARMDEHLDDRVAPLDRLGRVARATSSADA